MGVRRAVEEGEGQVAEPVIAQREEREREGDARGRRAEREGGECGAVRLSFVCCALRVMRVTRSEGVNV